METSSLVNTTLSFVKNCPDRVQARFSYFLTLLIWALRTNGSAGIMRKSIKEFIIAVVESKEVRLIPPILLTLGVLFISLAICNVVEPTFPVEVLVPEAASDDTLGTAVATSQSSSTAPRWVQDQQEHTQNFANQQVNEVGNELGN